jgi:hypothetical protein
MNNDKKIDIGFEQAKTKIKKVGFTVVHDGIENLEISGVTGGFRKEEWWGRRKKRA